MIPATIVELGDVTGKPKVKMDLPSLRVGDRVHLHFRLARQNAGRSEVLDVAGDFQVRNVGLDGSEGARQHLVVESTGVTPNWKAVKKTASHVRKLGPASFPRTGLE